MVFCINCGSEAPNGAKFCHRCGTVVENGKEEIKQFSDNDIVSGEKIDNVKNEVEYASIVTRLVAIFIDGIIINIIVFILALLISIPLTTQGTFIELIYYTADIFVFILYFTILEGPFGKGQTIGKRVTSIRVVNETSEATTYTESFIRTILRIIDILPIIVPYLLGAIVIHSSDKNQRIGDKGAKTIVINEKGKSQGIASNEISKKLEERRKERIH
jgi:uncharacterized RDD family membrane protein YckC